MHACIHTPFHDPPHTTMAKLATSIRSFATFHLQPLYALSPKATAAHLATLCTTPCNPRHPLNELSAPELLEHVSTSDRGHANWKIGSGRGLSKHRNQRGIQNN